MFKVYNIKATDFCSFKELDFTPEAEHTTLIFGNNLDNDSQGSNGSGKSALVEAIAFGLTGDTLRKVSASEIINDAASSTTVSIEIGNGTDRYRIERTVGRKSAQVISLYRIVDGDEEKLEYSSVSEYNSVILQLIGVEKDDLFNYFILSKHKFKPFLSASDKDKKEIINNFSGATLIDGAIEQLGADLDSAKEQLQKREVEMANVDGSLKAILSQIAEEKEALASKQNSMGNAITNLQNMIAEERNKASRLEKRKVALKSDKAEVGLMKETIRDLDISADKMTGAAVVMRVAEDFPDLFATDNDYKKRLSEASEADAAYEESLQKQKAVKKDLADKAAQKAEADKVLAGIQDKIKIEKDAETGELAANALEIAEVDQQIMDNDKVLRDLSYNISSLQSHKRTIQANIDGAIACPKCGHKFVLIDGVTVESLQKDLAETDKKIENAKKDEALRKNENNTLFERKNRLRQKDERIQQAHAKAIQELNAEGDSAAATVRAYNEAIDASNEVDRQVSRAAKRVADIRATIIEDVENMVDAEDKRLADEIHSVEREYSRTNGAIESYQLEIEERKNNSSAQEYIKRLEDKAAKLQDAMNQSTSDVADARNKCDVLKMQQEHFNGFKTHLANTKIAALADMTNNFLSAIGSDIRVLFSGYTVLKSGKVKDKISITLMRNGEDCGSFDKFSEGEKARVNLANILALHELTNANAFVGGGLDLLILDEILEAVDESGLANMFAALNQLKMTCLVVSHGLTSEAYPYRLVVSKRNGVSSIV